MKYKPLTPLQKDKYDARSGGVRPAETVVQATMEVPVVKAEPVYEAPVEEVAVEELSEECADYTEEQWEDASKEFKALVKKAEKYEDFTTEEKLDFSSITGAS